jgi:hypothetical protein
LIAMLAVLGPVQTVHAQATKLQINAIADPQVSDVTFTIVVVATDAGGTPTNVASNTTVQLTVASGTGALSGTVSRVMNSGTNTLNFPGVYWTISGAGKSVRATATVGDLLAPAVSNTFTVNFGAAYKLVFTTGPASSTAGANLVPVVAIQDHYSTLVTTDNRNITMSLSTNPSGATLDGTVTLLTVNGVATWTAVEAMNITKTGAAYKMRASHDGANFAGPTQYVDSAAFNITAAAHHHLVFSTGPANSLAGNDLLPAVRIRDIYDNDCTAAPNRVVQLSIAVNPGGATLNGTTSRTTASGVATWAAAQSLDITVPAVGYVLRATNTTAPLLPGGDTVDSAAFNITHNVGNHMDFTTQPVTSAAGAALVPVVSIQDVYHNPCTTDNRNITLGFFANPGGAVLNGTMTLLSVNGVATWTGAEAMSLTVAANGYQLQASHDGAVFSGSDTVNSAAFNIIGGTAHHLAFTTQPSSPSTAGASLLPVIKIQDQYNNTVSTDDRTITLTFAANPGGATLDGTVSLATVSGVATWTGVQAMNITKAANGYQLQASHSGAAYGGGDTVDSNAFNVTAAAADHLAFSDDPASSLAGEALLPLVSMQDVYGNTVTGDDRTITLTLMNAGGATLDGITALLSTNGLAQWTGAQAMNITKPGSNYSLRASHDGAAFLGPATADSATFDISHNVPHHLAFTVQPVDTTAGQALLPEVTILDLYDNTCTTDDRTITLSISTNPGGAALNGTVALLSTSGVATWAPGDAMTINTAATGYKLRATGAGAFAGSDNVDSNAFNITAVNSLSAFAIAPSANPVTVNNPITLTVTARDTYGNAIPNHVTIQTVDLTTTTAGDGTNLNWDNGPAGLTDHLDGTADLAVGTTFDASGRVTLNVTNRRAESMTITTNDAVTPATGTSAAVQWNPWFSLLLHITPPGVPVAGVPFDVDIYTTDQFGNLSNVTQNSDIRLRLSAGTGVLGGTIDGTIAAGSSATTISGVTYNVAEGNIILIIDRLNGDFLVAGTSDPVTVAGATPEVLQISPLANQTAGLPFSVTVTALDGLGNASSVSANTNVSLQLFTGTGVLSGTTTGTIAAGTSSVTINNVRLDVAQAAAAIRASRTSGDVLTAGDSNTIIVAPNSPTTLRVNTLSDQVAAVAFTVAVEVLDDYDNAVAVTANTDIALSLATGTGNLTGTLAQTLTAGSQSMSFSVGYDTAEAGVSVQAQRTSGDVLAQATSNVFTVAASPPIRLDFLPIGSQRSGATFSVTVRAVDIGDNEGSVTADTDILISLNTGTGILSAPSFTGTIPAGSSRITLGSFSYNLAENNISLRAVATSGDVLAAATSNVFSLSANVAKYLRFSREPTNVEVNAPLTGAVEVTDSIGNRSSTFASITLSLVDPGGCGTTLDGNTIVDGFGGLAEFTLTVPQPCNGYRLRATSPGMDPVLSAAFNITGPAENTDTDSYLPVDGDQTSLRITYVIPGSRTASPFDIRLGVRHEAADGTATTEILATFRITAPADRTAGEHTVDLGDVRPYLNGKVEQGDQIVIQIDPSDSAGAVNGGSKEVLLAPTVDLVNESLVASLSGDNPSVSVTYLVRGPANVPGFLIRLGLDTNGDGLLDTTLVEVPTTEADVTPGTHVITLSLASAFDQQGIASGQTISLVSMLDADDSLSESDNLANNLRTADEIYTVELLPTRLDHMRDRAAREFTATVDYLIADSPVSEDFTVAFYAALDAENAIVQGNVKVAELLITDAADKTHGPHTKTLEIQVPPTLFPGSDFVLKVRVDDGNAVAELDESNNALAMPRFTPPPVSRPGCGLGALPSLALSFVGLLGAKASRRSRPRRVGPSGIRR